MVSAYWPTLFVRSKIFLLAWVTAPAMAVPAATAAALNLAKPAAAFSSAWPTLESFSALSFSVICAIGFCAALAASPVFFISCWVLAMAASVRLICACSLDTSALCRL